MRLKWIKSLSVWLVRFSVFSTAWALIALCIILCWVVCTVRPCSHPRTSEIELRHRVWVDWSLSEHSWIVSRSHYITMPVLERFKKSHHHEKMTNCIKHKHNPQPHIKTCLSCWIRALANRNSYEKEIKSHSKKCRYNKGHDTITCIFSSLVWEQIWSFDCCVEYI